VSSAEDIGKGLADDLKSRGSGEILKEIFASVRPEA
jgi:hydroxymethylbilane synthase